MTKSNVFLLLFEENLNIDVIANPGLNRELKTLASLCRRVFHKPTTKYQGIYTMS